MGRKAKIDDATVLNLLDQFFIGVCNKDISMLKIPAFAEFVRKNGYEEVQDYLIRRNTAVRGRMEELKADADTAYQNRAVVFRNLDIDAFLAKHTSPATLKKALIERDNYYQQLAESATYCIGKYNEMNKQITSLTEENTSLKSKNIAYSDEFKHLKEELRYQQAEVQKLRGFIDTYINPEIANELLKKEGLLKTTSGIVDVVSIDANILHADSEVTPKNNIIRNLFERI